MMRGVTGLQNNYNTLIGVHSAMHVMHAPHLRHYNYYVHACVRTSAYSIEYYDFIAMYLYLCIVLCGVYFLGAYLV